MHQINVVEVRFWILRIENRTSPSIHYVGPWYVIPRVLVYLLAARIRFV